MTDIFTFASWSIKPLSFWSAGNIRRSHHVETTLARVDKISSNLEPGAFWNVTIVSRVALAAMKFEAAIWRLLRNGTCPSRWAGWSWSLPWWLSPYRRRCSWTRQWSWTWSFGGVAWTTAQYGIFVWTIRTIGSAVALQFTVYAGAVIAAKYNWGATRIFRIIISDIFFFNYTMSWWVFIYFFRFY